MKTRKFMAFLLSASMLLATVPVLANGELSFTAENLTSVTDKVILEFSEELDSETVSGVTLWQEGAMVNANIYIDGSDLVVEPLYMTEDTEYTIDITSDLKNFNGTKSATAQKVTFKSAELTPESYGFDNLNNEEGDLYIAYLGGSITQGTGEAESVQYQDGSYGRARWTTQLTKNYFEQKYPNKTVHEVNAGVGGTAADLGMFRIGKHIVEPTNGVGPDVVFVDVATNNAGLLSSRKQDAEAATEEIIRQLARLPKQPVVIFVINPYKGEETEIAKESVKLVEDLCEYYGLGFMEIQEEFKEEVGDNESDYFADAVHPNSKGYTVYAEKLKDLLEEQESDYIKKLTWKSEALHGRNFGNPTLIPANDERIKYSGTWTEVSGISPYAFQHGLMQTTENGASVTFEFTGTTFGILADCAEGLGVIDCTIDGKPCESHGSWVVHHREGFSSIALPTVLKMNLEPGKHTVVIKKFQAPEGYKNGAFRFGYFMVEEPLSEPLIKIEEDDSFDDEEKNIVINSVYPKNKAKNVSVLDDVEIILEEGSVASEKDIEVTGEGLPNYNIKIEGENIKIEFAKELPYNTDVSVKIGNDTFTFTTERNPITTLFYEDFNGNAATALARFEDVGTRETDFYEIYDGRLLMKTHEERLPNGGTPSGRIIDNDILYIKGSENWGDYTLDVDVANGWYTRPADNGEYYDVEAMMSVKTDKATGTGVASISRWLNPGKDSYSTMYAMDNFGATGSYHGGWNIFDSQYRTLHHMTIDAIGTDVSFKFTGYGADKSNRWTGAVAEGTRGGVTLRSSWGRIVYDNVLVTDKGLLFTAKTLKNIQKEIQLNFTESLDESSVEYIKVLKDGVEQNATAILGDDLKTVYVDVSGLLSGERYTLSVGDKVMSADKTLISSEKNVLFTTSDDFGVLKVTPAENEKLNVLSDIRIELTDILASTEIDEFISIYGMTDDKYDVVVKDGRNIDIIFKEALPYDSDIKLTVKKGLISRSGKSIENDIKYTFHTEEDTSDILYQQNFDNITTSGSGADMSGNKFGGLTVQSANNGTYFSNYKVENGELFMNLHWAYKGSDTGNLRFLIDGSENWTDYEISADFKQNVKDGEKWVWSGFGLRYNGENSNNSMKVYLNYLENSGSNPRISFNHINGEGTAKEYGWNTCLLNTNEWYRLTATVEGQKITGKVEKDGVKIREVSYDMVAQTGDENALNNQGYAYISQFWYQSYVDNIKVIDKGLKFTPSTTKYTDGKMTLDFDVPMNTANAPIVEVKDESGKSASVTAKWKGDRSISIDAKGLIDGELYTVTLKREGVESLDGIPLAADKTCKVIADVPCCIENVQVSDIIPGKAVSASADITDYGKDIYESYMLVLAVFDENGALYSIVTDTKKNIPENEKTSFSVTSIALPENAEGYRAECYIWDNMQNMHPVSDPVK